MANETYEQYQRRLARAREESRWPLMLDETNPDHWIYPMPSVEQVCAAGYEASYHEAVAKERAEMVRSFCEDPDWRRDYIAQKRAARARELAER